MSTAVLVIPVLEGRRGCSETEEGQEFVRTGPHQEARGVCPIKDGERDAAMAENSSPPAEGDMRHSSDAPAASRRSSETGRGPHASLGTRLLRGYQASLISSLQPNTAANRWLRRSHSPGRELPINFGSRGWREGRRRGMVGDSESLGAGSCCRCGGFSSKSPGGGCFSGEGWWICT